MATAVNKIMKAENVQMQESDTTTQEYLTPVCPQTTQSRDNNTNNNLVNSLHARINNKGGPGRCEKHGDLLDTKVLDILESEKTYNLPENWPKISQLRNRQWSCELSSCKTPSVKRAVSHIELFQNIIDDWFMRLSEQLKAQTDSCHSSDHSDFNSDMDLDGEGIPYLGAQEVIEEVITLLAELETDRRETQERYIKETLRADWLQRKIDELQLHRLQKLPVLVQREHEACIMDLHEMNWHVSYTKWTQAKAQNRFSVSKRVNTQMKEDTELVKQHIPLVQEKLILEMEAMDKIRKAQGEADQELVVAQQREAKTGTRSREAMSKAETERSHIKKEMERAREDLKHINEQLAESQMTYSSYVHQISDICKHLVDNENEIAVMKVKNEKARNYEEMQATKVRNLQTKLTEAEFDRRHQESDNQQMEEEISQKKTHHSEKLVSLEQQVMATERKLRMLAHKNLELGIEVKDSEEKIAKCNQQKATHEKAAARINQEVEKVTEMLHHTREEHLQCSNASKRLQDQLLSLKDQVFHTEEKLKTSAQILLRHIQEEKHAKTVLQARINSDLSETEKTKTDTDKKKEKAKGMRQEVEEAVSSVLEKVTKLQNLKTEMLQMKEDVTSKLDETHKQHTESQQRFTEFLERTEPQHKTVKNELNAVAGQLQAMEEHTKVMNSKTEEMDAAQIMMDRSVAKSKQIIHTLESENDELNLQVTAGRKIEEDLRRQYNDVLERLRSNECRHKELYSERQKVQKAQENEISRQKERNKELATRYRQLQQDDLIHREQMLRVYDERVKAEAAITDIKQLKSVQMKLHAALLEYFKLSGVYSEATLSKLEEESSLNGVRVSELQLNMEQALDQISGFLNSEKERKLARLTAQEATVASPLLPPIQSFHSTLSGLDSRQEAIV